MIEVDGERVEIGGCLNTLTSSRPQSRGTSSMAPNSCLVAGRALARPPNVLPPRSRGAA